MTVTANALPGWAKWLDALTLASFVIGIGLALSPARVQLDIGVSTVSLGSSWRPLLLALAVAMLRHWRVPRPHLGERMAAGWRDLRTPAAALSVRMLLTTRLPVLLAGYAAALIIGLPPSIQPISPEPLRDLPARWDATWYAEIARTGYRYDPRLSPTAQQPIVFFPLYPMLMRTLAVFTTPERGVTMTYEPYLEMRKVHLVWCGLVISLIAFAGAMVVVYRWAELRAGADAAAATVVLLSTYPFAVFFSAPYTESLYLLLVVGACYAFERGRLPIAAAAGVLAGLTRPNAVMLSLLLGLLALVPLYRREPGWAGRTVRGLATAAAPVAGMLLYCAFIDRLTGSPFTWVEAQGAWGRDRAATAFHYEEAWSMIVEHGVLDYLRAWPAEAVQFAAAAFSLALVYPVWRRIGPAYAIFMLANLLPPMIQGGALSLGRFTSTLFPQFLALALLIPRERLTGWIVPFAIGQGFVAAVFFTWRVIY